MRRTAILVILLVLIPLAAAHSDPDTPGVELHHLPVWGWALITTVILLIVYVMYTKTHDKPLNPTQW